MSSKNKVNQTNKFAKKSWEQNNDYTYDDSAYSGDYGGYAPNGDKSFDDSDDIVERIKRLTCCEASDMIMFHWLISNMFKKPSIMRNIFLNELQHTLKC